MCLLIVFQRGWVIIQLLTGFLVIPRLSCLQQIGGSLLLFEFIFSLTYDYRRVFVYQRSIHYSSIQRYVYCSYCRLPVSAHDSNDIRCLYEPLGEAKYEAFWLDNQLIPFSYLHLLQSVFCVQIRLPDEHYLETSGLYTSDS